MPLRFIDLFSGLGGFHLAMRRLGNKCVFASEINESLRQLYHKNFGLLPAGDIKQVREDDIPAHDILCAGFPCQPFSKAGEQRGFDCPKWGDLFNHVLRILRHHQPQYIILENVPNLAHHDNGLTWKTMREALEKLGYVIDQAKLSPHKFGVPQIRERIYIVGSRSGLSHFSWPKQKPKSSLSIEKVLDKNPKNARPLPEQVIKCLGVWQDFLSIFPKGTPIPKPLWSMEFGATYPYEKTTPHKVGPKRLGKYCGSHGLRLSKVLIDKRIDALPSHARVKAKKFPSWKIEFVKENRDFYRTHKAVVDKWLPKILAFPSSLQKLEWNCDGEERDIWKYVIQIRASGVRVKRRTTAPALIAMTSTQVPIIAWEKRYMTPKECSRLQSMQSLRLPKAQTPAYEALGNAVNVRLVKRIAKSLCRKSARRSNPARRTSDKNHELVFA